MARGTHEYDPAFTSKVIAATGPNANPRLAEIMPSLLRHLHDFAREVNLTVAEWMAGIELINEAGRMSNDSRNETQLVCDVLGLESLVDEITSKLLSSASGAPSAPTPSAILGPFYRHNAPILQNGSSIVTIPASTSWAAKAAEDMTYVSGRVLNASTGKPIADAVVDVWHTAPNGLYEQQDELQPDMNLRGRFQTDGNGEYSFLCLRPVSYPIPFDGPAGRLLQLLDRHPYRPAHIHFIISAKSYQTLVTQVFDSRDKHVHDDSVFAVKEALVVEFVPLPEAERKGEKEHARWNLRYDFMLGEEGVQTVGKAVKAT